mmetsp:Transcript_551/g.940  ORF Transcript_551/g.940 Transcript_551/m.940 type:complete len:273 (+) Transcript_551:16-834(+)
MTKGEESEEAKGLRKNNSIEDDSKIPPQLPKRRKDLHRHTPLKEMENENQILSSPIITNEENKYIIIENDQKYEVDVSALLENIIKLYNNESTKDLILKLHDKNKIRVHKFLFAKASPRFKCLVEEFEGKPIVQIQESISSHIMSKIIQYIYLNQILELTLDECCEVYHWSHHYKMNDLMDYCLEKLLTKLEKDNWIETLYKVQQFEELGFAILQFINEEPAYWYETTPNEELFKKLDSKYTSRMLAMLTLFVQREKDPNEPWKPTMQPMRS